MRVTTAKGYGGRIYHLLKKVKDDLDSGESQSNSDIAVLLRSALEASPEAKDTQGVKH